MSIYYETAEKARSAGELAIYRASAAGLREVRSAIDSAIKESFDGCRLDRSCLDRITAAYNPEAVAIILAATMESRSYDGRFSRDNRTWAAGVRMPGAVAGDNVCWYACATHSAVLDGFVNLFRKWQAEQ